MSKKRTFFQLLRYMVVGGLATCADISLFSFLIYYYGVHYNLAMIFGFLLGTLINFLLCNWFVFQRSTSSIYNSLIKHYMASFAGFMLNFTLFQLWQLASASQHPVLGRIVVAAFTFTFNFFAFKKFSFSDKST